MSARELLRQGDVEGSLKALFAEVRDQPEQPKHRIFLFQLLCVTGQWDRALTQLNVARDLDPEAAIMAQAFQDILQCEAFRSEVFAGKRLPIVFGEPDPWLAGLIDALRLDAENHPEQAAEQRRQAFETAPTTSGTILPRRKTSELDDDTPAEPAPFDWLADGDTRLGPVFEVITNGRYYWVPIHRVAEIVIDDPTDLRDLVWTPAHFRWANGGEGVGVIPTRYVGSESQSDDLRMARKTTWQETGEDMFVGLGQRVLMTDVGEHAIMDIHKISLNVVAPESTTK